MLKKKTQRRYLDKRWKAATGNLYAYADSGSRDTLHKLRVELKKIKAWMQFSEAVAGRQPRIKVLKKLFHQAGGIRDAQITLQLMQQYHVRNKDFRKEETHLQQESAGKLRTHTAQYAKALKKARKKIHIRAIRKGVVQKWIRDQLKSAGAILAIEQYHPARKKIKTLLYIQHMLPKRLQVTLNTGYLDKLQDKIGNWHDAAAFLSRMHKPAPDNGLALMAKKFPDKAFNSK